MFIRNLKPEEVDLIRRVEIFIKDASRTREGRDPSHVFEVVRMSVEIARRVGHSVHPLILVLTPLFNELGALVTGDSAIAGFVGASLSESYLKVSGVSDLERIQIVRAVALTGTYGVMAPETIEERIVSDAMRLNDMGLVGLVRGIGAHLHDPEEFLQEKLATYQADFEGLFFDESRQLGESLFNQARILAESFSKAFRLRPVSIEQIVLPQ